MKQREQPNLLLIWTDQQRADTLRCYGDTMIEAPNLNRLADESFVFRHAYCTQPVCSPSRASILTGLWPHTHGVTSNNVPLSREIPTLAEMLGAEYQCTYYGKWHLGSELSAQHGFSRWLSLEDGIYRQFYDNPNNRERRSDYSRFLIKSGFLPDSETADGARVFSRPFSAALAERYTKASFLGREAAGFLRRYDGNRPFFLSVNFLEPHPPLHGPLNHLYEPDSLPVGPSFLKLPALNAAQRPELKNNRAIKLYEKNLWHDQMVTVLETEWEWRRLRANYCGLVTLVDRAVGEILRALEASGEDAKTIVVFTSDHGDQLGDHGWMGKFVQYEESVRVPLLFRIPWLTKEFTLINGRVSQIDLVPTLLELLGREVPGNLQGKSRAATFLDHQGLDDNDVFIEWNTQPGVPNEARTLVSAEGWKLNLYTDDNAELFDLNTDPYEMKNQFGRAQQKGRIRDLATRLQAWQKETGDAIRLPVV